MNVLSSYYEAPSSITSLATEQIEFTLKTERPVFRQGEDVNIQLLVKNITKEPLKLEFSSTNYCEFSIKREKNFVFFRHSFLIWKSSFNQQYEKKENTIVLKPEETKTFKTTWRQVDASNRPVQPGKYSISAMLLTKNEQPLLQLKMKTNK